MQKYNDFYSPGKNVKKYFSCGNSFKFSISCRSMQEMENTVGLKKFVNIS